MTRPALQTSVDEMPKGWRGPLLLVFTNDSTSSFRWPARQNRLAALGSRLSPNFQLMLACGIKILMAHLPERAHRLDRLPTYRFAVIGQRIQEMNAAGKDVIRVDI